MDMHAGQIAHKKPQKVSMTQKATESQYDTKQLKNGNIGNPHHGLSKPKHLAVNQRMHYMVCQKPFCEICSM